MSRHVIHDSLNMSCYGSYTSEAKALRALTNAIEKGWKLDGRRHMPSTLARLSVVSLEGYQAADTEVETFNMLNPDAGPIMIKRSQKGTFMDPASESYHSM